MKKYDASSIKILKGLDAVRKRPGMYIGSTDDTSGLHRMIFEVVDNSVDESLAGYCSFVNITLDSSGFVIIFDNGRGMPTDLYKNEGKSTAEIIMTVLHSGAKFDNTLYHLSGGLHGVGISVVNALSKKLYLRIFRSGFIYEQIYSCGKPISKFSIIGHTDKRGTEIKFLPDFSIFKLNNFNYDSLVSRFRELSFLNANIKLYLFDQRVIPFSNIFFSNVGGIVSFIKNINKHCLVINKDILYFSGSKNEINFSIAMQWVNSFNEYILCYTNNVYQKDGGTHFVGFKNALTKAFKHYIEDYLFKSKGNITIQGEDTREGFVAVLSLYMNDPKFSSQVKDRLISLEVKQMIELILYSQLKDFLYENPIIAKIISNKIISSSKIREAAKKARDLSKKKNSFDSISLCTKLSDCQEKNPMLSELFLVEGDSAGGSAKQARDRKTQAILPLKGKILNVERAGFDKMLSSSEILSVVSALKCGVGLKEYNEENLRYHKVIFMTDADIDGAHIRTLLMTFFYRQIPSLIENNHLFVSRPPLYKLSRGKKFFYINDKTSFNNFLFSMLFKELRYANDLDISLLNIVLDLYKKILLIFENFSYKLPKVFFKKLLYFNEDVKYTKNNFFGSIFKKLQLFFDKILSNDKMVILNDTLLCGNLLKFKFFEYGVLREYELNLNFFLSDNYSIFRNFNKYLKLLLNKQNGLFFNNKVFNFYKFGELVDIVFKKNLSMYTLQRYKGLGEMNPQQLWDTTMNPETRNLHMVKIKDFTLANEIFASLMGDSIDERKKFIEKHSSSFLDLDF